MTRFSFSLPALLIGAALIPATGAAAAVDGFTASPESRFVIHGQRLEGSATRERANDRFRLDSRLQPEPFSTQTGGGLELRAELFDTKAAACGGGADVIFANGFE